MAKKSYKSKITEKIENNKLLVILTFISASVIGIATLKDSIKSLIPNKYNPSPVLSNWNTRVKTFDLNAVDPKVKLNLLMFNPPIQKEFYAPEEMAAWHLLTSIVNHFNLDSVARFKYPIGSTHEFKLIINSIPAESYKSLKELMIKDNDRVSIGLQVMQNEIVQGNSNPESGANDELFKEGNKGNPDTTLDLNRQFFYKEKIHEVQKIIPHRIIVLDTIM